MPKRTKRKHVAEESQVPARSGKPIHVWVDESLRDAFDRYVASLDPESSNRAVIESALRQFLREKGFWPPPE